MYKWNLPPFSTTHLHFLRSPYGGLPRMLKKITKKDNSTSLAHFFWNAYNRNFELPEMWRQSTA